MPAATARARVRAELTLEIKQAARRQLAETGASGLSLRAVAREVGMVSSAVYRYFPSRDALLTALIVDSYNSAADAAQAAEAECSRADRRARFLAVCVGLRGWAVGAPQEWALIFGSPVPGYAAPTDTIDPAARIPLLLLAIIGEAPAADSPAADSIPASVSPDLRALRDALAPALDEPVTARAIMAWTQLVGSISFELFGHLNNVIHDYPAYFEYQMGRIADDLGLA